LGGSLLFFLGLVSSFGPGHEVGDEVACQGVDLIVRVLFILKLGSIV
jgi:hypothetical protein